MSKGKKHPLKEGHYPARRKRWESASHFATLWQMAMADGHLDETEREMLHQLALRCGVPEETFRAIVDNPKQVLFVAPQDAESCLTQMVDVMNLVLADGHVAPEEVEMAKRVARKLNFAPALVLRLLEIAERKQFDPLEREDFKEDPMDYMV